MIRSQLGGLRIKFTPFFSQSGLNLLPTDARHIFVKRPFVGQSLFSVGVLGALSACGVGVRDPNVVPPQTFAGEARPDNWPPPGTINFGDDTVKGVQGDDRLEGGKGDDEIDGGKGDDLLMGDSGNPFGGGGDDEINGGEGNDIIDGGAGDDKIDGGKGSDRLTGGSGDDTFTVTPGDVITDFRSPGQDIVHFADISPELGDLKIGSTVDNYYDLFFDTAPPVIFERFFDGAASVGDKLLPFAATSSDFTDVFSGVTLEYDGTAVNDEANTVTLNDPMGGILFGFGGDDELTGGAGKDFIFGGDGDDEIDGLAEADVIYGGDGSDTINGGTGDDIINGGNDDDEIDGGDGNDELNGGSGDDILNGGDNDDTINGGSGSDTINGGDGNDTINGGSGSDTIDGGAGNDKLTGGSSADTFVVSTGSDTITDFQTSDDFNFADNFNDGTDTDTSTLTFSDLTFSVNGNDNLDITFSDGASPTPGIHTITIEDVFAEGDNRFAGDSLEELINVLAADSDSYFTDLAETQYGTQTANDDSNTITLAAGVTDTLYGFGGSDKLTGNDEANTIYGGNGSDKIDGGGGDDNLYGGSGSDTFIVSPGGGSDTIHDFSTSDELDFSALINDSSTISDLSFTNTANTEDLQIIFTSTISGTATVSMITLRDAFAEGGILRSHYDTDAMTANILDAIDQITEFANANSSRSFFNGLAVTYDIDGGGTEEANDSVNTITLSANVTDILYGFNGNDVLTGNDGANSIYGGDDNDKIDGGGGNDSLYGGDDNDKIFGGAGNDNLYGGDDSDTLDGGAGNDNLYGERGNDTFVVSTGSDTIHDFASSDKLDFSNFNDGMTPSTPTLTLADLTFTTNPNDMTDKDDLYIIFNDGANDHTITIEDMLVETNNAFLPSSLANSLHTVVSRLTRDNNDFLLGLDYSNYDDDGSTVNGDANANKLFGLAGDDTLNGMGGADTLYGGDDDDTLDGGEGDDILVGGGGSDSFVVSAGSDIIADFRANYGRGSRDDIIDFTGATFSQLSFTFVNNDNDLQLTGFEVGGVASTLTLQNAFNRGYAFTNNTIGQAIERMTEDLEIYFDGITDTVTGDDEDSDESIDVTSASMTHFALGGDDTITVTATSGTNGAAIFGGSGNDQLTGGDGADLIHGGSGSDTINGGSGTDTLYGGSGNDTINGGDGDDTLDGGSSNDKLDGGDGVDTLDGGAGNDELDGGAGNDTLDGGANNDELDGGAGDDTLTGGAGNDTFLISTGNDIITDFSRGDQLDFSNASGGTISFALGGAMNENLVISGFDSNGVAGMVTLMDVFGATMTPDGAFDTVGFFHNRSANMGMGAAFSLQHALDVLLHDDRFFTGIGTGGDDLTATANGFKFGFSGDDTLTGVAGGEKLYGGSGNDTLHGLGGADDLYGGAGNDTLVGDKTNMGAAPTGAVGNDIFHVSLGADTITDFSRIGTNNDILDFGYFRDDNEGSVTIGISDVTITQSDSGDDVVIRGHGTGGFFGTQGHTLTLQDILGTGTANDGIDTLQDFTDFFFGTLANAEASNLQLPDEVGTDGGDDLTATASDRLYGFGGVDTLTAHENGSYLYGGDGGDTLNGAAGDDKLFGGAGNDTIIGGAGSDTLGGGGGTDTLTGDFTTPSSDDRFYNDTFIISEGNDTITDFYLSESPGGERDVLDFSNFRHLANITSQGLNFAISGSDLQITGYAGHMLTLQNVFATDGVFYDSVNGVAFTLNEALLRLNSGGLINLGGTGNLEDGDNIFGSDGDNTLDGDGDQNMLFGGDGRDTLNGGGGNDELRGGNHHDMLNGGDGEDELFGEGGGDDLDGGDGDDELTGGAGDDYFRGSGGTDTITDFQLMDDYDVLDFSNTDGIESTSDLTATFTTNDEFALLYDHDNDGTDDAMFVFEGTDFAITGADDAARQAAAEAILQQLFDNDDILVMNGNNDLVFL